MMLNRLGTFITNQRDELSTDENNYFGLLVFGEVSKYYQYVLLIVERYRHEGRDFFKRTEARFEWIRQPGPTVRRLTAEEERQQDEDIAQRTRLHLEIESFFIFACILLDRIAGATQYYFGAGSKQWKSFQSMKEHFKGYARNKGLSTPSEELLNLVDWLYNNVSVFRHELLVHKHEDEFRTRLHFATGFDNATGETYLILGLFFPEEGEEPRIGERPEVILAKLDNLIDAWLDYLSENTERRSLQPAPKG